MCAYIGKKVNIKYDPEDMAVLYIFDDSGKKLCEAYCQELLQMAPKVAQKALEEHLKMQKRQIRRDQEILKDARRPLEELNAEYIGFSDTAGGISLMEGKKRDPNKVVSMPADRTYQNGFRAEKREDTEEDSGYLARRGESALKKIRAMGE